MAITSQYGPGSQLYQNALNQGTQYSGWSPFSGGGGIGWGNQLGASSTGFQMPQLQKSPANQNKPAQYTGLPQYGQQQKAPTNLYQNLNLSPFLGNLGVDYQNPGGYRGTGIGMNLPLPGVTGLKNMGLLNQQQYAAINPKGRQGETTAQQYAKISALTGVPVNQIQSLLYSAQINNPGPSQWGPKGQYSIGPAGTLVKNPTTTNTTRYPADAYEQMKMNQLSNPNWGMPYAGQPLPGTNYQQPQYSGLPQYGSVKKIWGGGGVQSQPMPTPGWVPNRGAIAQPQMVMPSWGGGGIMPTPALPGGTATNLGPQLIDYISAPQEGGGPNPYANAPQYAPQLWQGARRGPGALPPTRY